MTARDELQQLLPRDDDLLGPLQESLGRVPTVAVPVDLARRVLAEMDEAEADFQLVADQLDNLRDDLAAALAKLDAIRALKTKRPRLFGRMQWEPILSILDGEDAS